MGSIADTQLAVRNAKAAVLAALEGEALKAGADAAALVENRIVSTGKDKDGKPFSPYSTKEVPAFFYFNRSRNNAGETAIRRQAKAREPVSYKEFRQLNGLNTANKNFEFTGEMWQGFGVTGVRVLGRGIVEVTIGGKNTRTESLLGYHSEREGTPIEAPSKAELDDVRAGIEQRLIAIIRRYV